MGDRGQAWFLIALLVLAAVGGGIWLTKGGDFFSYLTVKEKQRLDDLTQRVERLERERDGGAR